MAQGAEKVEWWFDKVEQIMPLEEKIKGTLNRLKARFLGRPLGGGLGWDVFFVS